MELNFSAVGFVGFVANLLIAMFFLRFFAAKYHDTTVGKALGYLIM